MVVDKAYKVVYLFPLILESPRGYGSHPIHASNLKMTLN